MLKNESEDRRSGILEALAGAGGTLTGAELAEMFHVSRQVIVQDIAILRAAGHGILASPQGYLLLPGDSPGKCRRTFAVQHDRQGLEKELLLMVDNGGKVIDVVVEHALYGEIKGLLMLNCREDVYTFEKKLDRHRAKPLSSLTEGVHLHTVEADSEEILDRIGLKLVQEKILLNK